jgi:hypothetical protein
LNYLGVYFKLIAKAQSEKNEGYLELHHIVPRSVYGLSVLNEIGLQGINDEKNLVFLTARQHYIAHWLLARAFPDIKQLVGAFWAMANFAKPEGEKRNYVVSSRAFEEARQAFSKSKYIPVIQYTLNGEFVKIFDSRQEASAELGIPPSGFVKKSAGGFLWEYYTDNFPSSIEPYFSDDASKPVIQLSPDRNFYLNTFDSAVIASKSLGISYGHISSVCNGSRTTSGGYSWVFEDEFDYNLPKGRESNDFYQKLAREIALEKSSSAKFRMVAQYTLLGDFIKIYDSILQASAITKTNKTSLSQCCGGKIKSANGFMWRFVQNSPEAKIQSYLKTPRIDSYKIGQYNLNGILISVFNRISEASHFANESAIRQVVYGNAKTAGGYLWTKFNGFEKIAPLIYNSNRGRQIVQIDKNSKEIIGYFDNLTEASNLTGYNKTSISKVLNGNRSTAYGFIWVFKE